MFLTSSFSVVQLIAAAVSLIGIILTAVAAIRATNPVPQIVVTLVAVAVLAFTVLKSEQS